VEQSKPKPNPVIVLPMPPKNPNALTNANNMVMNEHLKGKTIIVFVYSPMCGYCMAMREEWNDAAEKMAKKGIVVVEMDVGNTDDTRLPLARVLTQDLKGVPHIQGFHNKTNATYDGERTSKAITTWAQNIGKTPPQKNNGKTPPQKKKTS
jgi:thiol-disulfide isomerase/thioredoxin